MSGADGEGVTGLVDHDVNGNSIPSLGLQYAPTEAVSAHGGADGIKIGVGVTHDEDVVTVAQTVLQQMRADAEESAKAAIRIKAATDKIAELEKLEATQEEIGVACATIARQNNMTIEQLKPYYDAEFEAAVIRTVLMSKAMKVVRDTADITETVGK